MSIVLNFHKDSEATVWTIFTYNRSFYFKFLVALAKIKCRKHIVNVEKNKEDLVVRTRVILTNQATFRLAHIP